MENPINTNSNIFEEKLQAMRATYTEKHEKLVEAQRKHILTRVNDLLDEAHEEIKGISGEQNSITVHFSEDEFFNGIQPETVAFLKELGFLKSPHTLRNGWVITMTW